jgi:hypothetical protein
MSILHTLHSAFPIHAVVDEEEEGVVGLVPPFPGDELDPEQAALVQLSPELPERLRLSLQNEAALVGKKLKK